MRYSPAIRRFVGAVMRDDETADDVAQDVIVRLLQGDFGGADADRGRFRDFLRTAIRNMVRNQWSRAKRRRGAAVDVEELPEQPDAAEDGPWLAAWRRNLLDNAWAALEDHQRRRPGSMVHTVLRLRTDHPDDTSAQLAARLSKSLGKEVQAAAVRQQLRRARVKFAELLVEEVADGLDTPDPGRVEGELLELGLSEQVRGVLGADLGAVER